MKTSRHYLNDGFHKKNVVEFGIQWLSQKLKREQTGMLVVSQKASANANDFHKILGHREVAELLGKRHATVLDGGKRLILMTKKIIPAGWDGGPVLIFHPTDAQLVRVEHLVGRNATAILVIPWSLPQIASWAQDYGAIPMNWSNAKESVDLQLNTKLEADSCFFVPKAKN